MTRVYDWGSFDPFGTLSHLQAILDRSFERPARRSDAGTNAAPPANIFRDADGCIVTLPLPGLDPNNLDIQAQENSLTISGKRSIEQPVNGTYQRRERWSGEFSRTLRLPDSLDASQAEASYRNGVLALRVPLRKEARARTIQVASTATEAQS